MNRLNVQNALHHILSLSNPTCKGTWVGNITVSGVLAHRPPRKYSLVSLSLLVPFGDL